MNKLKIKGGNNAIPEAFRQSFQAHEEPIPPEEGYRSTDMEVILDHLGTLLVQTAACVLQLRDAFSELAFEELDDTEALADGEEEDDHEVLILTPSGYAEIAFSQECKERFDWFNKVSVFEPVPDCDNLFITCDPN
ncbi:MAG: hypothetical protein Q4B26_14650, partial [Eubacteriales bacterium]|nr:hypothetical protein [Eubacteriales bacterium]